MDLLKARIFPVKNPYNSETLPEDIVRISKSSRNVKMRFTIFYSERISS